MTNNVEAPANGRELTTGSDWLYRRNPKACKLCRQKKVRCDGVKPTCHQCRIHRSTCVYLPRAGRPAKARALQTKPQQSLQLQQHQQSQQSEQPEQPEQPQQPQQLQQPQQSQGLARSPSSSLSPGAGDLGQHYEFNTTPTTTTNTVAVVVPHAATTSAHPNSSELETFDLSLALSSSYNDIGDGCDLPGPQTPLSLSPHGFPRARVDSFGIDDSVIVPSSSSYPCVASLTTVDAGMTTGTTAAKEDLAHSLQRTRSGHVKYLGPCVSFIPATRIGQAWITQVTGSDFFSLQMQDFLASWSPNLPSASIPESSAFDFSCLPPLPLALEYVHAYFDSIESTFPILDRVSFLLRYNASFPFLDPLDDPTWCAQVNVVLALGCRASPESNEKQACALYENALCLFAKVTLGQTCIIKVQTLALMYIFLAQSPSSDWGYTFLTCATREAFAIGLHLKPQLFWTLSEDEIRQRNLLFWSLYLLDSHLMFRLGRPPSIRTSDITLDMPEHIGLLDETVDFQPVESDQYLPSVSQRQLLIANITMSHLMHEANTFVSGTQDFVVLQASVNTYEEKLSRFVRSLNPSYLVNHSAGSIDYSSTTASLIMPIVTLNTSIQIARWIVRLRLITAKIAKAMISEQCLDLQTGSSLDLHQDFDMVCEAAATLIEMNSALPKDRVNHNWYFAPLSVYALYVLFIAIIYNPLAPSTAEYMELISIVIESTVHGVVESNPLIDDPQITHFLTFFARTARMAIRRSKRNRSGSRNSSTVAKHKFGNESGANATVPLTTGSPPSDIRVGDAALTMLLHDTFNLDRAHS